MPISALQSLYFLRHATDQQFKIGIAIDPTVRALQLPEEIDIESSVYFPCSTVEARKIEAILHTLFREHRRIRNSGEGRTEWFSVSCFSDALAFLEQHRNRLGISGPFKLSEASEHRSIQEVPFLTPVHIVIQGKGGIGKSLCARCINNWLLSSSWQPIRVIADPNAPASHDGAHRLDFGVFETGEFDQAQFDDLWMLPYRKKRPTVVDMGPAAFFPFIHYVLNNDFLPELLREMKIVPVLHLLLCGGEAYHATVHGIRLVSEFCRQWKQVAWLNSYFGPVEPKDYAPLDSVIGWVELPRLDIEEKVFEQLDRIEFCAS